jgi:ribosome-associated protein
MLESSQQGSSGKAEEVGRRLRAKDRDIAATLTSLQSAKRIARFAFDKKAENIVLLNMKDVVNYCDHFVICSGTSSRHVKAIADGIEDGLQELGIKIRFKQGMDSVSKSRAFSFGNPPVSPEDSNGRWVLLDMGDVVVHIFEGASREFYALEHLWNEAKQDKWQ